MKTLLYIIEHILGRNHSNASFVIRLSRGHIFLERHQFKAAVVIKLSRQHQIYQIAHAGVKTLIYTLQPVPLQCVIMESFVTIWPLLRNDPVSTHGTTHCETPLSVFWKYPITHTEKKPFPCSLCDKALSWVTVRVMYMRTHTAEKPIQCSHCDKAFSHIDYLQIHHITHTGERPFSCSHCDNALLRMWQSCVFSWNRDKPALSQE